MIDREKFNDDFSAFDKEDTIEIIGIYLSEYQKEFLTIRNCIAENDFQNLKYAICRLRGYVSCFCDPVVIEQSRRLDAQTRNNNQMIGGFETLVDELEVSSGLMAEELKKIKEELLKS